MASGEELQLKAKKELQKWSLFGIAGNKYENAAEFYKRAAAKYKTSKDFEKAGECFMEAAKLYEKVDSPLEAVQQYRDAGKALKKDVPGLAREAYAHAINYYQDSNRFNQAAKLHVEIAQTWLDEGKVEEAMQSYRNASDCHIADDSQSASNKVLLEVAFHAAASGDFEMAIQYYEQNARDGVDNQLIRWSVKNYLFSASLCQLCLAAQNNSLEQAKEAHDRYCDMSEIFRGTREQKVIEALIDSMFRGDIDVFTQLTQEYDDISKFNNWQVDRLLFTKKTYFDDDRAPDLEDDLGMDDDGAPTFDGNDDEPDLF